MFKIWPINANFERISCIQILKHVLNMVSYICKQVAFMQALTPLSINPYRHKSFTFIGFTYTRL